MTPERQARADGYLAQKRRDVTAGDLVADFFQWKRVREDLIHFTPIDSLPEIERDAIRRRRFLAFKNSRIPWQATDATALLTAIDDVDDMSKVPGFIRDYAVRPLSALGRRFTGKSTTPRDANLDAWRDACAAPAAPRERKRIVLGNGLLDLLGFLGLGALSALFPAWAFALRALQFLQVTDSLFGVGIQLGPAIGLAAELAARAGEAIGLPFGPEHNKYHQLLAAGITQSANKLAASDQTMHPEDRLTTLLALHRSSESDLLPHIVLGADDYPNLAETITHPWQAGEYAFNFARLAASIPYNLGADLVNATLGGMLGNWSTALDGAGPAAVPTAAPNNQLRAVMKLADQGVCPAGQCDAELYMQTRILTDPHRRIDVPTARSRTLIEKAKDLGMDISQVVQTLLGT